MLKELYIRDFALIDQLKINFVSGFNVFTGETGAGKSIIMDALSFVLGKRADKTFIRQNKDKAVIEAVLFLKEGSLDIDQLLKNEEIDLNDRTLLLRREIFEDGHSTCRINGRLVTVNLLRKLTSQLISVHEQNEFQEIMLKERQLQILDRFANMLEKEEFQRYTDLFAQYSQKMQELRMIEDSLNSSDINREIDILDYQMQEIDQAKGYLPMAFGIQQEIHKLEQAEEISASIDYAYEKLYAAEHSIVGDLHVIIKRLERFSSVDNLLDGWISSLYECLYTIEDIARSINSNTESFIYDEVLLDELMKKNNILNKLFSKYGKNDEEVMRFYQEISARRDFLSHRDEKKEELRHCIAGLEEKLSYLAAQISAERRSEALKLEEVVREELHSLGMLHAQFKVDCSSAKRYLPEGKDEICFMVSFSKGEPLKPFHKIASGGEVSRFVLSLKKVTAKSEMMNTMVFDEIDSGISGISAKAVGRKLKEISRDKQVICITHLPQVAANGDSHYLVSKMEDESRTYTDVRLLEEEMRIEEIGKMISGEEVTQNSRNYAQELLLESKSL